MIAVEVHGNFDRAIRLFKERVKVDGILKEITGKEYYLSRTQRRKLKNMQSRRRLKKLEKRWCK